MNPLFTMIRGKKKYKTKRIIKMMCSKGLVGPVSMEKAQIKGEK